MPWGKCHFAECRAPLSLMEMQEIYEYSLKIVVLEEVSSPLIFEKDWVGKMSQEWKDLYFQTFRVSENWRKNFPCSRRPASTVFASFWPTRRRSWRGCTGNTSTTSRRIRRRSWSPSRTGEMFRFVITGVEPCSRLLALPVNIRLISETI